MVVGIVNFALSPLLARSLGPVGRGSQSLVSVCDDASTAAFLMGIPASAGYEAKLRRYDDGQLLGSAVRFGILATPLSVAIAVAIVLGPLGPLLDGPSKILSFLLIGLSPLVGTIGVTARQLLVTRGDLTGVSRVSLVAVGLRSGIIITAFVTHSLHLAVAIVAISFTGYAANVYALFRLHVRPTRPTAPLLHLLRYGVKTIPSSLSQLSSGRIDQLLLAPFLSSHDLGLYAVSVTFNFAIVQLGHSVGVKVFYQAGASATEKNAAARTIRQTICLLLFLGLGLAVFSFAGGVTLLLGSPFSGASLPCLLLIPGSIAYAAGVGVIGAVCQALGRPGWNSVSQVTTLVLLAAALPFVAPRYGLVGVALASTLAYVFGAGLLFVSAKRMGVAPLMPQKADLYMTFVSIRRAMRVLSLKKG